MFGVWVLSCVCSLCLCVHFVFALVFRCLGDLCLCCVNGESDALLCLRGVAGALNAWIYSVVKACHLSSFSNMG